MNEEEKLAAIDEALSEMPPPRPGIRCVWVTLPDGSGVRVQLGRIPVDPSLAAQALAGEESQVSDDWPDHA